MHVYTFKTTSMYAPINTHTILEKISVRIIFGKSRLNIGDLIKLYFTTGLILKCMCWRCMETHVSTAVFTVMVSCMQFCLLSL